MHLYIYANILAAKLICLVQCTIAQVTVVIQHYSHNGFTSTFENKISFRCDDMSSKNPCHDLCEGSKSKTLFHQIFFTVNASKSFRYTYTHFAYS